MLLQARCYSSLGVATFAFQAANAFESDGNHSEAAFASPETIQKGIVRTLDESDPLPFVGAALPTWPVRATTVCCWKWGRTTMPTR